MHSTLNPTKTRLAPTDPVRAGALLDEAEALATEQGARLVLARIAAARAGSA